MMPISARDGWLEELLEYLDDRQDINGGGDANDYMRWYAALKAGLYAISRHDALYAACHAAYQQIDGEQYPNLIGPLHAALALASGEGQSA